MSAYIGNRNDERVQLGFWLYLMTDAILFAAFFATFVILRNGTNGGVDGRSIFDMHYVLVESLILLLSTVTVGVAAVALQARKKRLFMYLLIMTLLLGQIFVGMEFHEFSALVSEGESWKESAFLSSYFALVGLHGLHVSLGILWGGMLGLAFWLRPDTPHLKRKFTLFAMFWHFLDLVWIFIFTIVYVLGVI